MEHEGEVIEMGSLETSRMGTPYLVFMLRQEGKCFEAIAFKKLAEQASKDIELGSNVKLQGTWKEGKLALNSYEVKDSRIKSKPIDEAVKKYGSYDAYKLSLINRRDALLAEGKVEFIDDDGFKRVEDLNAVVIRDGKPIWKIDLCARLYGDVEFIKLIKDAGFNFSAKKKMDKFREPWLNFLDKLIKDKENEKDGADNNRGLLEGHNNTQTPRQRGKWERLSA